MTADNVNSSAQPSGPPDTEGLDQFEDPFASYRVRYVRYAHARATVYRECEITWPPLLSAAEVAEIEGELAALQVNSAEFQLSPVLWPDRPDQSALPNGPCRPGTIHQHAVWDRIAGLKSRLKDDELERAEQMMVPHGWPALEIACIVLKKFVGDKVHMAELALSLLEECYRLLLTSGLTVDAAYQAAEAAAGRFACCMLSRHFDIGANEDKEDKPPIKQPNLRLVD